MDDGVGKSLDARVAEEVCGWRWVRAPWVWDVTSSPVFGAKASYLLPPAGIEATRDPLKRWPTSGSFTYLDEPPPERGRRLLWYRMPAFSTSIEAAWTLWEILEKQHWTWAMHRLPTGAVAVALTFWNHPMPEPQQVHAVGDTASVAICLAALRAVAFARSVPDSLRSD